MFVSGLGRATPGDAKPLRAASGQIAFGFLEKNRKWCGRDFTPPVPETFAMARMVAVDVAIAHRGPRDIAG
jgi:hypothetical protein